MRTCSGQHEFDIICSGATRVFRQAQSSGRTLGWRSWCCPVLHWLNRLGYDAQGISASCCIMQNCCLWESSFPCSAFRTLTLTNFLVWGLMPRCQLLRIPESDISVAGRPWWDIHPHRGAQYSNVAARLLNEVVASYDRQEHVSIILWNCKPLEASHEPFSLPSSMSNKADAKVRNNQPHHLRIYIRTYYIRA